MKSLFILAAAAVVLAAGLVCCLIRLRQLSRRCRRMEEEHGAQAYQYEYDKNKAEILSLQSQINPHFLYNTLEGIRSEAIINDDPEAAEMSEALANYFRYNISRKGDIVSLGEELDNVDNYISIQKRRFEERIRYEVVYHTDEKEARSALIPKLSLQPLVENSIYHGIEKRARGGWVAVHVTVTEKRLLIQVQDNGPGMDEETLKKIERRIAGYEDEPMQKDRHGGIALANINKRIHMLYGDNYGLTFSSILGVGAQAELTIPYYVD